MAAERLAQLQVRGQRIDVPDALRPKGTMTAAAAAVALAASRAALLDAARAADPVALERRTSHHAVIGRLTLRGWLAFVAHHEARHAAQIDEIAAAFQQSRVLFRRGEPVPPHQVPDPESYQYPLR